MKTTPFDIPSIVLTPSEEVRAHYCEAGVIAHPFEPQNSFRALNNTAFASGIFTAAFGSNASLLNYGILLFFPLSLFEHRADPARTVPPVNFRLLARHGELDVSDIRGQLDYFAGVKSFAINVARFLRDGYISTYLDEYYIDDSPTFGKWHNKHETLMCGYNPIDDTAKVCLYDKSGEFRSIDIPFTHLLLAFISEQGWPQAYTYDERDRIFGFCDAMRKPVFLVKVVASREAPLDKRLIFRQIDDALNSASTYGEYVGDPMRNWTEGPGSYGLSAYRTCADFMAMCRAKRLPMDIRVTRLLFEHKSLMIERLEHLRRAGCNIHENVVQAYKGLLISTKALHLNMVASLKRGGDFDEGAVLSTMRNIEAIEADALRSLRTELV